MIQKGWHTIFSGTIVSLVRKTKKSYYSNLDHKKIVEILESYQAIFYG